MHLLLAASVSLLASVATFTIQNPSEILPIELKRQQPVPPKGNCTDDETQTVRSCYVDYFRKYGYSVENSTLPDRDSNFFPTVFSDSPIMCSNYASLKSCESSAPAHCSTFHTLVTLTGDTVDAFYYVQQLSLIELYCDYNKKFVRYSQCMTQIEASDLHETVFDSCSMYEEDNCPSVAQAERCERGVVVTVCDAKASLDSWCTYQNIQMRMTGWIYCDNLPCSSAIFQIFSVITTIIFLQGY